MNEEDLAKIRADLEKSGMQSELMARNIFASKGWSVSGGAAYLDRDEGKSREIDLSAHHGHGLGHKGKHYVFNSFYIIAEVKKSERPWVVFKKYPPKWFDSCAWDNLISKINLPCEPSRLTPFLSKHSLLKVNGWEGTGIHEAFKKPDQPSRWYSAFVSVCKAAAGYLDEYASEGEVTTGDIFKNPTEFTFIQPLVILDGPLVTAELTSGNEMLIEEVSSAAFRFEYKSREYSRGSYRVDLVTMSDLANYLDLQVARQKSLNDGIRSVVSLELDEPKS